MLDNLVRKSKSSMGIYESDADGVYGMLAEFKNPAELLHAAEDIHQAGYVHFDTHSPFPIHGMDKAMGLGNSKVGYITLLGGITGLSLATWLQWWTSAVDYPLNISGKPFFSIEPSVPVMFELTVLFSALATVAGMLALNGLPRPYNPVFYSKNFSRVTDDAFMVNIAASDPQFDRAKTEAFLKELGGTNIELIYDHGTSEIDGATPDKQEAQAEVTE